MRRSAGLAEGCSSDRTKDTGNRLLRPLAWAWHLVVRNRIAIAIASLIWLVWRSGTQPRRLAYPCQQAAAANLGFLAVLFIPGLARMKAHQAATVRQRAMSLAAGSVCLAGMLFILVSGGIAVYSEYVDNAPMAAPPPYTALGDPTTVAIVKEDPVTNIEQMVRDAIALAGGLEGLVNDNDTVVIKPNLVQTAFSIGDGRITRAEVVAAVVEVAKEAATNVTVKLAEGSASSDGGNEMRVTMTAFQNYGYDSNADGWFDYDTSVELVDLNDTGGLDSTSGATWVPISGVMRSGYWVNNVLHNADVFISVPTFKNHGNAGYTGAMKNQIGSAPGDLYHNRDGNKQPLHRGLHFCYPGTLLECDVSTPSGENDCVGRSIVDLNLAKTIDFVVIDALVGIDDGPGGTSLPAGGAMKMIVAGRDALAVDTIGTIAMGYEPDQIGHIAWAASTGALGTKDRDAITVVGDHVDVVRHTWWVDWPPAVQETDHTNPVITSINISEGQTVSGVVSIVGSGVSDNVDVIKSELYINGTQVDTDTTNNSANFSWNSNTVSNGSHQIRIYVYDDALNEASITRNVTVNNNLVANGDFSSGLTNWTEWSGWGNGTQTYDSGVGALKLECTSGGSFGVYQEVSTTPGHTYSIDAYWKANKYGDLNNWYEIMLIDDPFSMYEADSGGAAVVTLNHMYAYDMSYSETCGSGGYPIPASFDWVWTHTQNNENVDNCWNDRDGKRTASGNTMTVVLKAGAFGGQAMAWFDEVSLVDVTSTIENCSDGIDNDGDGLTDCCDTADCGSDPFCTSETICSDGVDNDCDSDTDCCDGDCSGDSACGATELDCDDGVDNDCDGLLDCLDTDDCADDPACQTPDTTPPTVSNVRPVDATDPADCIDPPTTAEVKANVSDDRGISASGICLMPNDLVSTNVLTNPSFEDGGGSLSGWNTSDVSWTMNGDWYMPAAPYDGSNYASIQCSWGSPGDSHELRQTVSVASNQPYFLSIYAQANSNDRTVYHSVRWYDGADPGSKGQCTEVDATTNTGGIWTQLSGLVVPTGSTMTVCYRAEASCVGQWGYGFHFDLFTLSPMTSADSYDGATATWNSVQFNSDQDHVKVVAVDDAGNSSAMVDSYDVGWYYDGIEPECEAPPDTTPPSPDPMTWVSVPVATGTTSIAMTATTASDPNGVEYYFTCIAGGGHDSGWQSSPTYEDTGLQPDTTYTYTLKARDLSLNQNETGVSSAESATTDQDLGWTVLTYDNFEGGFGNYTDGGGDCSLYIEGTHAHQGDNAADIQDNSGISSSFYHTNSYDVTSYVQLRVTFWYKPVGMETGEDFFLEYDDGGGWAIVEDWISGTDFSNDQFYNPTVFLDSGTYNFTATAQFRFRCDAGSNTDDIYIDEVEVAAIGNETCAKPVLTGAVSRKTHIGAGDYDIDVGIGDIESRSAQLGTANPNELTIIADFDIPVVVLGGVAAVQTDIGTVTSVTPNADSDSSKVEINITDLMLNCQVNLSFADTGVGVVDANCPTDPAYASDSTLCIRVIVGDYDNAGSTNFIDFAKVTNAGHINQLVDSVSRARADFDCSGRPNFTDFSKVKNADLINQTADECTTPIGP